MKDRIENFIKNILTSFSQQNLDPLTYVEEYQRLLSNLDKDVYVGAGTSWFSKYMDVENYLVMNDGSKVYTFKPEINTSQKRKDALAELQGIISKAKEKMESNFKIANMKRTPVDGVVIDVTFIINFSLESITDRHVGSIKLVGDPSSPDFVAFNELTEELVIEWVKDELGADKLTEILITMENRLQAKLDKKNNPEFIVGTPWGNISIGLLNSLTT
jgi:hypothetical protein